MSESATGGSAGRSPFSKSYSLSPSPPPLPLYEPPPSPPLAMTSEEEPYDDGEVSLKHPQKKTSASAPKSPSPSESSPTGSPCSLELLQPLRSDGKRRSLPVSPDGVMGPRPPTVCKVSSSPRASPRMENIQMRRTMNQDGQVLWELVDLKLEEHRSPRAPQGKDRPTTTDKEGEMMAMRRERRRREREQREE